MPAKKILLLGSTGSIGRQTLEAAANLNIKVMALAARSNVVLMEEQARRFRPALAALESEEAARDLRTRLADTGIKVVGGKAGVMEAALWECDMAVAAMSGSEGLLPVLAAIDAGRDIALANKETLVCAGEIVTSRAREKGVRLVPVDSEHSAVFQCLNDGQKRPAKIILTASGGPFRDKTEEELGQVTVAQALSHPNWNMGKKVTIDSATMFNKALELIEAHWLFDLPEDKIEVLVHPQSIVHSFVEFEDGSVLAQMALPDMRLPIQYALTCPGRAPNPFPRLELARVGRLDFFELDSKRFPAVELARHALRGGGVLGAALSAADEEAVELFLEGKIAFTDITRLVSAAVMSAQNAAPTLENIAAAAAQAREAVRSSLRG